MWTPSNKELASLVAQMVKNLPALQETQVQSLGREDPREKEMAIHSSTLAWKTPWTEEHHDTAVDCQLPSIVVLILMLFLY